MRIHFNKVTSAIITSNLFWEPSKITWWSFQNDLTSAGVYQNEPQADVGEDLASTIALAAAGRHVETIDLYKADNSSLGFSVVSVVNFMHM